MAILKGCELWFVKLDPAKPNTRFDTENPTWEVQIRTRSKSQANSWKDQDIRVIPDENDDGVFYRANLKKKSKKRDGTEQKPVDVGGGSMEAIDLNAIGNGSIANIRIFQYPYNVSGKEGIATMLMAVQVTKLLEYTPKPREDDFEMVETEIVKVVDNQDLSEEVADVNVDELDF